MDQISLYCSALFSFSVFPFPFRRSPDGPRWLLEFQQLCPHSRQQEGRKKKVYPIAVQVGFSEVLNYLVLIFLWTELSYMSLPSYTPCWEIQFLSRRQCLRFFLKTKIEDQYLSSLSNFLLKREKNPHQVKCIMKTFLVTDNCGNILSF